ncbi:CDP-glycerol glycerophosphotransferase family protein [Natronorarus salvus]|uniref:CDP-glycerol glycerophosphotransferase family protein n=1 Tax=Natronorarus salvus TaxID=3117733 RepID=UPI002F263A7D
MATVLFALSLVSPRDDSLWVFGSNGGDAFRDNAKYLYLHAADEREHVRAVWLSRNEEVIERLRSSGYEAYHVDSLRGIRANLRAGYVFVTHGMPDVNRWCSGGATKVLLWHGVALKRIGWDAPKLRHRRERLKRVMKDTLFDRYDWITVPSEAMVGPFASAFRIGEDRVLTTGYPRNDVPAGTWTGADPTREVELERRYRAYHEEGPVVLYMPTIHRETGESIVDHLDLDAFDQWLAERDARLLFKPHPAEPIDLGGGFSRIEEVPEGVDVYPLLEYADVVLTDYSSVYFDFLLLDRPVVFYPFDLLGYREERGFYPEYEAVTPGPVATTFAGLLDRLDDVLETDEYAADRTAVREEFLWTGPGSRCRSVGDRFDPRADTSGGR